MKQIVFVSLKPSGVEARNFYFHFLLRSIRFWAGVGELVVVLISSKDARTVLLFTPTVLRPPRERFALLFSRSPEPEEHLTIFCTDNTHVNGRPQCQKISKDSIEMVE